MAVKQPNSSSWSNPNGIRAVATFAKFLVTRAKVTYADIGIISMYKDDMHRIRKELSAAGLDRIEVATVDLFQGREKNVMLVHFVAAFDRANPFGFVHNANRLCVATTRCKEFQFFFGNFTFWKKRLNDKAFKGTVGKSVIDKMMRHADKMREFVPWNRVGL